MIVSQPLFSIVIPTRNRAHLLKNALQSAINQEFTDYEIIVCANNCNDNTREVVSYYLFNPQIHYFETEKTLSMPENWEYAWSKAQGKYVIYLPDDDALTPNALKMLVEKTLFDSPTVVCWEDAIYYYPCWHDKNLQNTLLLFYFGDILVEDISSKVFLKKMRDFTFEWSAPIPKLLNCAANREFFENWRKKLGTLFFPIAPDYSFAWITTHITKKIRVLHYPLSVRGISQFSIGSDAGLGKAGKNFFSEFGEFDFFKETHINLPLSINHLAATFLRVNKILCYIGMKPSKLNNNSFLVALAVQLKECEQLLSDFDTIKKQFIKFIRMNYPDLFQKITYILSPKNKSSSMKESIRDLHRRTAKMAIEYAPNIEIATKDHGDDSICGACSLSLREELLVDKMWDYLWVFGEKINANNPFEISKNVDSYYQLLSTCRQKKLSTQNKDLIVIPFHKKMLYFFKTNINRLFS